MCALKSVAMEGRKEVNIKALQNKLFCFAQLIFKQN